jgi:hypothetical protein
MTQDVWLSSHPYLRPVAELHALVNDTLADAPASVAADLHWHSYLDDFHRGVPLLHSPAAEKTLTLAEEMIEVPLAKLTSSLHGKLAEEGDASLAEIHRGTHSLGRVVNRLLGGAEFARAGLLRFLGWDRSVPADSAPGGYVRRLARRRAMAPTLLPDVRIASCNGSVGWH